MQQVLLYFWYAPSGAEDPKALGLQQRNLCQALGIAEGRIRVSSEGINATVCGSQEGIRQYVATMHDFFEEKGTQPPVDFKTSAGVSGAFEGLVIRECAELVTLFAHNTILREKVLFHTPYLSKAITHASPEKFHEILKSGKATVVDVRNGYESSIGTMRNSVIPNTRQFSDFVSFAEKWVPTCDKATIAMFCTGGVRCERAAALVANLQRDIPGKEIVILQGGVARYLEAFPEGGEFMGKLLVFDGRGAIAPEKAQATDIIGHCSLCAAAWDEYGHGEEKTRCSKCRQLVLVCAECQKSAEKKSYICQQCGPSKRERE